MVPVRLHTKLRNNRIFKALPRLKKSFKPIDFDLTKHISLERKSLLEFVWKI